MDQSADLLSSTAPAIFILSGGIGASAEQVIYTVLAQFPDRAVKVITCGNIRQADQLEEIIPRAVEQKALLVHTLVDESLRLQLQTLAAQAGLACIDLMGPLSDWLSQQLGQPPLQQPGRYRRLHRDYFERVSAIDYTLMHDDGKRPEGWHDAEIVLAGVSRAGKTPLSLYLAVLGWRVANIPLVPQVILPQEIYNLDTRRCVGLTIDAEQLLSYRRQRQARMGVDGLTEYTDLDAIREELRYARAIFNRCGFRIMDMTDKTIEMAADDIIRHMDGSGSMPESRRGGIILT